MRITLVGEGTSDQALIPIIQWAVQQIGTAPELELQWADLHGLPIKPRDLSEKIRLANELFPCDILVVHRDADNAGINTRRQEIVDALGQLALTTPHVCIVPVRMTEAWLLFSEDAIRFAAGNPYSRCGLALPTLRECERLANPKQLLFDKLRIASELTGRRLQKFDRNSARSQIARYIDDFSPLRNLDAFRTFEANLNEAMLLIALQD